MSIEIDMSSLTKKLSDLEKKVSNQISKDALLAGAKEMEKSLKNEAPIDTGELHASIKEGKIKTKKGTKTIEVGLSNSTGASREVIERGFCNHYGARSKAPTRWMDIGFDNGIKASKQEMIKAIKEGLK